MSERGTCAGSRGEPLRERYPDEYPASAMKEDEGRCPVCGVVQAVDEDGLVPPHPPRQGRS